MESLRYLPFLANEGWIITNTTPFINIPNYPDLDSLLNRITSYKNVIAFNTDEIARRIKAPKASNVVILGAASSFLEIPIENLQGGIRSLFARKGEEIINMNISALNAGLEESKKYFRS